MADNDTPKSNGGDSAAAPQQEQQAPPQLGILGQYLKDLSFENPNAPQSLALQQGQPQINIGVNVNAQQLGENDYEVTLEINAKAEHEGKVVFLVELTYCGIFRLQNIPQEMLSPVVLVECPRMLFPFARRILADVTRDGGFPPLMLDPIDFGAMYAQRLAEQQQAQADGAAGGGETTA